MTKTEYVLRQYFLGRSSTYIANELGVHIDQIKGIISKTRMRNSRHRALAMTRETRAELTEKLHAALSARGWSPSDKESDYWRSQTFTKRGRPKVP